MSASLKQIGQQALMLAPEERAQLAESMIESLRDSLVEVGAAWEEEIERRVAAFDRGEIPAYQADDVFAEAVCIK